MARRKPRNLQRILDFGEIEDVDKLVPFSPEGNVSKFRDRNRVLSELRSGGIVTFAGLMVAEDPDAFQNLLCYYTLSENFPVGESYPLSRWDLLIMGATGKVGGSSDGESVNISGNGKMIVSGFALFSNMCGSTTGTLSLETMERRGEVYSDKRIILDRLWPLTSDSDLRMYRG